MQNMGRTKVIMLAIDQWLRDNIDDLFHLDNIEHYLEAVGVRGHIEILKEKARAYLLAEAENLLLNKNRRRRVK